MHTTSISRLLLFTAATVSAHDGAVGRRQDGPVDPGTAADCTWFDTAYDSSYDCVYFTDSWGLTLADFLDWNPGVGDDCSGIKVGNSYCVEVNFGLPRPTTSIPTPTTSSTTTTDPGPTGNPKPSPTQEGLIDTCTQFYAAVDGDNCDKIVRAYGTFTLAEFVSWNPAVGNTCGGLWLGYYYCVGIPGTPTAPPPSLTTTTTARTTTTTVPSGPTPTQEGIVSNCQRYHLAGSGDTCQGIVNQYGTFSLAQFKKWNPAVGDGCTGLWLGYHYCIGIPGTPTTTRPTATTTKKPPPPAETCNPAAPAPTQPGATCGCKKWHKVAGGNTCASIIKKYGIAKANFHKWNPRVGTNCKTLWLGYYVCVGH